MLDMIHNKKTLLQKFKENYHVTSMNSCHESKHIHSKPPISYPDHLQQPLSLLHSENQSFFSGSKVTSAHSLTNHICLAPSFKNQCSSTCLPPWHILGQLYFTLPTTYLQLSQEVTSFLSYKGSFLCIT